ncbi:hypothetical protein [Nocardiopsis synnemataformans]|uniref:hypothetical protein n=1 Tax=Nocardiopsis synnemataformans TaxID=61305 RepID=UPI003EBC4C4D
MVAMLNKVPLARISARAGSPAHLGRTLLTLLAAMLYGLGWLLGTAARGLLTGVAAVLWAVGYGARWAAAAVAVGWQDASTPRHGGV